MTLGSLNSQGVFQTFNMPEFFMATIGVAPGVFRMAMKQTMQLTSRSNEAGKSTAKNNGEAGRNDLLFCLNEN